MGEIISCFPQVWCIKSDSIWPLLFLQLLSEGHRTRLTIRSKSKYHWWWDDKACLWNTCANIRLLPAPPWNWIEFLNLPFGKCCLQNTLLALVLVALVFSSVSIQGGIIWPTQTHWNCLNSKDLCFCFLNSLKYGRRFWTFDVSMVIWQIGNLGATVWIWKVCVGEGSTILWQGSGETSFL